MRHGSHILLLLAACSGFAQESPDPRGPVVNTGMTPRITAEGVDATGYRFVPAKETGRWQAQWIWLNPAAGGGEAIAASFRKNVTLPAAPKAVRARISADIVYRLWINGQLVSRGPADPGNDYSPPTRWSHQWLYDVRDLTPSFKPGDNVIAAEVFTREQPNYSLGRPGFAFAADSSAGRVPLANNPRGLSGGKLLPPDASSASSAWIAASSTGFSMKS